MSQEVITGVEDPLFLPISGWVKDVAQEQIDTISQSHRPYEEKERRIGMIWDKIIHIGDCVQAAMDIVSGDPALANMKRCALLMAVLHDVGRFKQAAEYGDYSDFRTKFDHAHEGSEIFRDACALHGGFGLDPEEIDVIADAIWWHSSYSYDGSKLAPKLLRDLDKLALLRRSDYQIQTYLNERNGFTLGPPTPVVETAFNEKRLVPNDALHTVEDGILRMMSWWHDIRLDSTKNIIIKEGLIEHLQALRSSFGQTT
jgi:hypothetical protein